MPRTVDRDEVRELLEAGATVVEVLPREEYEEEHLPGALSIPLGKIDEGAKDLDPAWPIVVYCYDRQ